MCIRDRGNLCQNFKYIQIVSVLLLMSALLLKGVVTFSISKPFKRKIANFQLSFFQKPLRLYEICIEYCSEFAKMLGLTSIREKAVSYTHLDVYKRQALHDPDTFRGTTSTQFMEINRPT